MSDYSESESESRYTPVPAPAASAPEKPARKRKQDTSASKKQEASSTKKKTLPKPSKRVDAADPFGILDAEKAAIAEVRSNQRCAQIDSTFSQKVANGTLRRVLQLEGEFYVELKIFHTSEIAAVNTGERWKKAVTTVKVQLDPDTSRWHHLHKFIGETDRAFGSVEPIFYSDKVAFKTT